MKEEDEKTELESMSYIDYIGDRSLFIREEDLKLGSNTKPQKKSERLNRNYDFLFEKPDQYSISISDRVKDIYTSKKGIKATFAILQLQFKEKVRKLYLQEKLLQQYINSLTSGGINNEIKEKVEKELVALPLVDGIEERNGVTVIRTTQGDIQFSEIERFFPNILPDSNIRDINLRRGNCHVKAMDYAKKLNALNIENTVATGHICYITDRSKILHSWNEFVVNGQELVLDYTDNIVMNKEGYYFLKHIREPISIISGKDIEEDEKIYEQITNNGRNIDVKTYLVFRDEIMRDLRKNIEIFDTER